MQHSEDDLIGDPVNDVPQRDPDDDCNARRDDDGRFIGYCDRTSGWGTDGNVGRCSTHGGNGGAPEGNTNAEGNAGGDGAPEGNIRAIEHGAYADESSYYQDVLDEPLRDLVDEIFADYLESYRNRHGEPPLGIKTDIF